MKSIANVLFSLLLLFAVLHQSQAQTSIPVPNSSFENWSNGNGYNVQAFVFSLPVYGAYTYPSNWNYPAYPVNQSLSYLGYTVNINTNLPLLIISHETSNVPEGNSALKMQSFMLSDIIGSTVYSLAQSTIDPELTTMVIPTILSTGNINIDHLFPLMSTITANMGSIAQLMASLIGEDMNDYIEGGIPLNGLVPSQLTGRYKYTSASNGNDNGGVLMLGTKYNPTTLHREVVGAGYTTALTDTSAYTSFDIIYRPLGDIFPTQPMIDADSLVIFIFSSANNHRQQGSVLYLDNLQLWGHEPVIPEDTCADVNNLTVDYVDTILASIGWTFDENPDHWEAEYGVQGFTQGSGNMMTTINNSLILSELQPDTYYDVYVRSVCNDSLASDWAFVSFKTDTLVPPITPPDPEEPEDTTRILSFAANYLLCFPNPAHGQCSLQFTQAKPLSIQLFSMDGKLLQQIIPYTETFTLLLPYPGIFILRCETDRGIILRKITSL